MIQTQPKPAPLFWIAPNRVEIAAAIERAWRSGCERHDGESGGDLVVEAVLELYGPTVARLLRYEELAIAREDLETKLAKLEREILRLERKAGEHG